MPSRMWRRSLPRWRDPSISTSLFSINPLTANVFAGNSIVIMFRHQFGRGTRWAEAYLGGTPALDAEFSGPGDERIVVLQVGAPANPQP